MDRINEFLKNNYSENIACGYRYPNITKRVECADGFSISVQTSSYHYCAPRENKSWPYSEVELGFPNMLDELIEDYAEDHGTTETVYRYVPIGIVNELIEKHGGIVNE